MADRNLFEKAFLIRQEEILSILKSSPLPLTATDLRMRLRMRSIRLSDYEVLRELRSLRQDGLVSLQGTTWRPTSPFVRKPLPHKVPMQTVVSPAIAGVSAETEWTPSKSIILDKIAPQVAHRKEFEEASDDIEQPDYSGPWGMFRKLLGYYIDCVRNDEGCEASGFLQDYGKRFIFLNQAGFWYPKPGKRWRFSIVLGPNWQGLLKDLASLGEGGVLVLGYPFQVFAKTDTEGPDTVFVKPIFTYQISWEVGENLLHLSNDDPFPEINLDWLTYALKKPGQQKMFLASCGLMDHGRVDESSGNGSRYSYAPDMKSLAVGVTTFFSESIREPLRPECVSGLLLPEKPLSGIYNSVSLQKVLDRSVLRIREGFKFQIPSFGLVSNL